MGSRLMEHQQFIDLTEGTYISGLRRHSNYLMNYLAKTVIATLMLMAVLCIPDRCAAQQVVDKMVATVNGGVRTELISYSDLLWQLALQPDTPLDNPSSEQLNGALRLLIDQRLILQEADKLQPIVPTSAEVAGARAELARHFSSEPVFRERLQRVGLTSEKLDEIIEQRLKME